MLVQLGRLEGKISFYTRRMGEKDFHYVVTCHNMVMDRLNLAALNQGGTKWIGNMLFGSGSAEPTGADTQMTAPLWSVGTTEVSRALSDDMLTYTETVQAFLPASTSYVGTIREVGLDSGGIGLITHSLLVDAENNPIEIEKDDLTELIANYSLTWTAPGESNHLLITALSLASYGSDKILPVFRGCGYYSDDHIMLLVLTNKGVFTRIIEGAKVVQGAEPYFLNIRPSDTGPSWDANSRTLTARKCRLAADQCNTMYIEHMAMGGNVTIEAEFPNTDIFPEATLSGMNVALGDGLSTEFEPPIDFWLEDTEEIFVDGVKLIAGVDYTCDFYNNRTGKYGLFPTSAGIIASGEVVPQTEESKWTYLRYRSTGGYPSGGSSAQNNLRYPDRLHSTRLCPYNQLIWARPTSHVIGLTTNKPLIIELPLDTDSARDWSMDQLHLQQPTHYAWTARLSYSDDGEAWTLVGEATFTSYNTDPRSRCTFTFTPTVARYWKIEYVSGSFPADSGYRNIHTNLYIFGRRTGQKIIFNNAPADGAVITMNARIDRPLKNDKHVIDFNPSVRV